VTPRLASGQVRVQPGWAFTLAKARVERVESGRMAASMRDVAKLAGVSQRTVSNVVNGYVHVRPETRRKVHQAIDELRYRPNVSAQKLRAGKTGLLALAIPDIASPYFAELADHIQRAAAERGLTLLIDQTGGLLERELLVLDGYRSNLIDGLILSPLAVTASDLAQRHFDFPTVLLGESIDRAGLVHVSVDNVSAARTATEHLLSLGRQCVAAVGAPVAEGTAGPAAPRFQGYRDALRAGKRSFSPDLVFATARWTRDEGYHIGRQIAAANTKIDAAFCFNDVLAVGLMKGLIDSGRRIPEDVAVVGWDDISEAAFATPRLTTIAPDKGQIARLAVAGLLERVRDHKAGSEEVVANYALIRRESTGG
jgi:DNA-binding LacI/PurR family transcriptional regulator